MGFFGIGPEEVLLMFRFAGEWGLLCLRPDSEASAGRLSRGHRGGSD
jgi:hypothetical protein